MVGARFLRTFAQSLIAVFFGIYLIELGYSLVQMGLLVTIGSVGSALFAMLIVFIGDTLGRRRLLIVFTAMMALAGLGYAFTERYTLLAFVSFSWEASLSRGADQGGRCSRWSRRRFRTPPRPSTARISSRSRASASGPRGWRARSAQPPPLCSYPSLAWERLRRTS